MIAQSAEGAMRGCAFRDGPVRFRQGYTYAGARERSNGHCRQPQDKKELCDAVLEENRARRLKAERMLQSGIEPHNILKGYRGRAFAAACPEEADEAYRCANLLRVLEVFIYNQNILRYATTPDAVLIVAVGARRRIRRTWKQKIWSCV